MKFTQIEFLCCAAITEIVEERLWEGAPAPESLQATTPGHRTRLGRETVLSLKMKADGDDCHLDYKVDGEVRLMDLEDHM